MKIMSKIIIFLLSIIPFSGIFSQDFNGFALYNKQNVNTAYLFDENGDIAHSWSFNVACNYTVLLKENGNIA